MTLHARSALTLLAFSTVLAGTLTSPLAAQDSSRTRVIAPFDTQHVHKTLFTWRDAALAGGFTALTVAMFRWTVTSRVGSTIRARTPIAS